MLNTDPKARVRPCPAVLQAYSLYSVAPCKPSARVRLPALSSLRSSLGAQFKPGLPAFTAEFDHKDSPAVLRPVTRDETP